ncbi:hypothetical protein ACWDD9_31750 [Kitasatospora sp. NPDC001119]
MNPRLRAVRRARVRRAVLTLLIYTATGVMAVVIAYVIGDVLRAFNDMLGHLAPLPDAAPAPTSR